MESGNVLWDAHLVEISRDQQRKGNRDRAILLITRLFNATFLTSIVGAMCNWVYEWFFDPEAYAAGSPFFRALWVVGITVPFILAGLLVLGLPTAYLLKRGRAESIVTYAFAGFIFGALCGYSLGALNGYIVFGCYGGACAMIWWWLRPRS